MAHPPARSAFHVTMKLLFIERKISHWLLLLSLWQQKGKVMWRRVQVRRRRMPTSRLQTKSFQCTAGIATRRCTAGHTCTPAEASTSSNSTTPTPCGDQRHCTTECTTPDEHCIWQIHLFYSLQMWGLFGPFLILVIVKSSSEISIQLSAGCSQQHNFSPATCRIDMVSKLSWEKVHFAAACDCRQRMLPGSPCSRLCCAGLRTHIAGCNAAISCCVFSKLTYMYLWRGEYVWNTDEAVPEWSSCSSQKSWVPVWRPQRT